MVTAKRNSPSPDTPSHDEDMMCARPFKRALVSLPAAAGADSLRQFPHALVQPCPGSAPWPILSSFPDSTPQSTPQSSGTMGGWSFRSQPYPNAPFGTVPPSAVAQAPMEMDSMSVQAPAAPTEVGQTRRQTMAWAGLVFNRAPAPAEAHHTQRPSSAPPSMGAAPSACTCSLLPQVLKGGLGGGALVGRCRHCDRGLCATCVKRCARCEDLFCTLCSTVK